jgi:signal transduction histidine kinase
VQKRTSELAKVNAALAAEIAVRLSAERHLHRLNRLYRVLCETNQAIVRANDRDTLFDDICRIVVGHGEFRMAWVGLVDDESGLVKPVTWRGASNGYLDEIRIAAREEPHCLGPTGTAIREGYISVCNDMQNDTRILPWRREVQKHGFLSAAAIGLKVNFKVIGSLTIYGDQVGLFTPAIIELLKQMAMDISLALENLDRQKTLREKDQLLIQQSRQAAMGEMIGHIAHQWRQPLNALSLIMQSFPVMHDMGELSREYLVTMENQAMQLILHMSQTIDDFRNYFRPDKEKMPFSVKEAVSRTFSLIEESFRYLKIGIEIEATDNPVIIGYPNEYSQALLNILSNARDALSERRVSEPRIRINMGTEDGKAVVTVADNAGGISEKIMDRIFEPYFTTKDTNKGTGVGLFMSKSIIEKNMGGKLSVRNTGKGAEFRIEV